MRNDQANSDKNVGGTSGSRRKAADRAPASSSRATIALEPNAVDAAMADDTTGVATQRGSRRDLVSAARGDDAAKRAVDHRHIAASESANADGRTSALLRSLAEQLAQLQTQQSQIRRLLELAESHYLSPAAIGEKS